jgi:hypothetical protein
MRASAVYQLMSKRLLQNRRQSCMETELEDGCRGQKGAIDCMRCPLSITEPASPLPEQRLAMLKDFGRECAAGSRIYAM